MDNCNYKENKNDVKLHYLLKWFEANKLGDDRFKKYYHLELEYLTGLNWRNYGNI